MYDFTGPLPPYPQRKDVLITTKLKCLIKRKTGMKD